MVPTDIVTQGHMLGSIVVDGHMYHVRIVQGRQHGQQQ